MVYRYLYELCIYMYYIWYINICMGYDSGKLAPVSYELG